MRLAILSDTHGFHRGMGVPGKPPLPDADTLIHCGDYSRDHGSWKDTVRFAQWMGSQPHKNKIVCPGNHEAAVDAYPGKAQALFLEYGIHMLGKTAVEIDGIRFDGGPYMPISGWDPPWGFEMSEDERQKEWGRIDPCHVLVTHTPPKGILDATSRGEHLGCPVLRKEVLGRIRPRLHCFGHVHEGRGLVQEEGIWFLNSAAVTRRTYSRNEEDNQTNVTLSIRDACTFDLEGGAL